MQCELGHMLVLLPLVEKQTGRLDVNARWAIVLHERVTPVYVNTHEDADKAEFQ